MIRINYGGMTGNNLFQYAVGRLLAEETGMALSCDPIDGFQELRGRTGDVFVDDRMDISDQTFLELGGIANVADVIQGKHVTIKGQFEMFWIYAPFVQRIRSWFKPIEQLFNRTVVHVRGGDHKKFGQLPFGYYDQALGVTGRGNATVYTDDLNWDFPMSLSLPVKKGEKMEDFNAIRSSRQIILSLSTFAWWAAFLSDAELIVQPVPIKGFRSILTPNTVLHVPTWASIPCEPLWADG